MIALRLFAAMALGPLASPCLAQGSSIIEDRREGGAATIDIFASSDADDTEVLRAGLNLDWVNTSDERYQGIRVEKAWFTPLGQKTTGFERVYVRHAEKRDRWAGNVQVGTDGHTVLGSVNVADTSRYRKELFVERDILETPMGVRDGLYYTFAGAAVDLPLSDRDSAVIILGAQEFTGKNVRLHGRSNYIHVIKPEWGLTAQLRGRYFHSTHPGEYDYYSPRWYAEVLPVMQVRRHFGGWRYLLAAGYGAQRDSGSAWRSSRYLNAQVGSPASRPVTMKASLVYSNTPVSSGTVYDYLQGSFSVTSRF